MATLDNERYLRHILLLGEGGLLVLRGIVTREAARSGQTLEHILASNRALFHNLIQEQYIILFPSTSTVNADVQTWDMSLLMVVVKRLFFGMSGLSPAETASIQALKAYRNCIQGHPTSMSMSATDYARDRRLLETALSHLASGISADMDTEIKDMIRRTDSGHIDIQSSFEHIKELHAFKTSFLDALESKLLVLTDINCELNDIKTCLNNMDGNHAGRYDALQKQLQEIDITTGATKNDMADMKAQQAKTSRLVEKILKMKINDCTRSTKNALQTIIEAKCDQKQKQKDACVLLFKFVEMIQNQDDFSKEEIKQIIEQWVQYHGDLCLELVDELIRWFTDMRNIPFAVPGNATLGCIRIPVKCSSMKGMLKHLEYMNSEECKQRLSEISCSLSKMLGFSCCLSWTIVPDSLQIVMKTLSEELETHDPTSETVKIVLPFQTKSLEGLTNIWTIFEGEEANSHLTKVSETLSKIVGANVSVTASVVMDQFTKAVYERSKDNISSLIDTKVQGQEQLGNIQDGGNTSDESTVDRKDAAQGNTEMHISPSSEFFKDGGNISDESTADRKDAAQGTTEMDILSSSEFFKETEEERHLLEQHRKIRKGKTEELLQEPGIQQHIVEIVSEEQHPKPKRKEHDSKSRTKGPFKKLMDFVSSTFKSHRNQDPCGNLKFVKELVDIEVGDTNSPVIFTCELNTSQAQVEWYFRKQLLYPSNKYAITVDGSVHMLTIKDVSEKDEGKYMVLANGLMSEAELYMEELKSSAKLRAEEFKKQHDDTLTQTSFDSLNAQMPYVGTLIIDGDIAGTVFRVGTRHVMTAFHVIRRVVYDESSGQVNIQHFERKDIYVNFNESIKSVPHIMYTLTCVFYNIELDVAVIDLNSFSGLPGKMLLYKGDMKIKMERVSVVGYGNPRTQLKKSFDPFCKVVPQNSTQIQDALDYLESNRNHFKEVIVLNPETVDDGYQGYNDPQNIIFHGYLEHGASGGPLLVSCDSRTVLVVGVLTHGIPECFYHLPAEEKDSFPKQYIFHLARKMKCIYEAIKNENEYLARDLFGGQ